MDVTRLAARCVWLAVGVRVIERWVIEAGVPVGGVPVGGLLGVPVGGKLGPVRLGVQTKDIEPWPDLRRCPHQLLIT